MGYVVQNMAIAATELGVSACHIWGATGVLNGNAELMKELKVPEGMVPCCAIALGRSMASTSFVRYPKVALKPNM